MLNELKPGGLQAGGTGVDSYEMGDDYGAEVTSQRGAEYDGMVTLRRAPEPTVNDCGVYYQRCGGGRRVIRKAIGGN